MRVIIAGGGTGGHLYPGLAIAQEVTARGGEVLFVGTTRGLEARVVPASGYALELLAVSGLKRVGPAALVRGLARLPVAFGRSASIVRRFRPDVALGVGGYASGPLVLAAALLGYPAAIQEQNSVPGFTNRTLARFVRVVFAAFEEARRYFPEAKVALAGNPVRRSFVEAAAARAAARNEAARSPGIDAPGTGASGKGARATGARPRVLVVGGSQGARAVNDSVMGAAAAFAARGALPELVHQTGAADEARVREAYGRAGLADKVTVAPFIEDMAQALTAADVVIARAGALTLAELAVVGRPAILIPLPTAADDHQSKNAEAFAAAGAALVLRQSEATPERLAAILDDLLADSARRAAMSAAMRTLARPDAASAIVDRLQALAQR